MKLVLMLCAIVITFPVTVFAEKGDMYVLGTGEEPDQETQNRINHTRAQALRLKAEAARSGYYFYNGDDGLYIGRGVMPQYNYNNPHPAQDDVTAACQGLRERQYRRCVDDAIKAREKLQRKYRN
jgi:hypothetical protein